MTYEMEPSQGLAPVVSLRVAAALADVTQYAMARLGEAENFPGIDTGSADDLVTMADAVRRNAAATALHHLDGVRAWCAQQEELARPEPPFPSAMASRIARRRGQPPPSTLDPPSYPPPPAVPSSTGEHQAIHLGDLIDEGEDEGFDRAVGG